MNKAERIACLYLSFLNGQRLSFSNLRKMMPGAWDGNPESARRKFERDKDELRKLGLSLSVVEPGSIAQDGSIQTDYVYYYPGSRHSLPDVTLSSPEVQALLESASAWLKDLAASNFDGLDTEALYLAFLKIAYKKPELLLSLPMRELRQRGNLPPAQTSNHDSIDLVYTAILERRKLTLEYQKASGQYEEYQIWPHGLLLNQSRWCMVAWFASDSNWRYFYLDQIKQCKLEPETFTIRPGFHIRNFVIHPLTVRAHTEETVQLRIRADYYENVWEFLHALPEGTVDEDGDTCRVRTTNIRGLFSWMLKHPEYITGLGDELVYQKWLQFVKDTRELYAHE
ncbi:MAG: WYL domain-containing protein [Leptospiraceae bacterium]|nr:WYL domain-containing protein [Leptospiraceae bacterium]